MVTRPTPEHLHSVTPALVCTPCAEAIDFYRRAFGAEEIGSRMTGPDGSIAHAEIRIGDSVIMLGDEWPEGPTQSPTSLGGSTAALFIYTDDVDALWDRAIAAGAEEVFPLEMQFYGDRGGRVRDPFGHTWGLAEHVEDVSSEEMQRRMAAFTRRRTADPPCRQGPPDPGTRLVLRPLTVSGMSWVRAMTAGPTVAAGE